MKNLFYSEGEKILFWVAGYVGDNLVNINKNANECSQISGAKNEDIFIKEITESNTYLNMKVYWCVSSEKIPEKAFKMSEESGWTMWKWIRN